MLTVPSIFPNVDRSSSGKIDGAKFLCHPQRKTGLGFSPIITTFQVAHAPLEVSIVSSQHIQHYL